MKKEMKKNDEEKIYWYDSPNSITTMIIIVLGLIIVLSQSFAVKNDIGASAILTNLFNHNSIYIVGLLYFIPLKGTFGKRYFNFFNLFLILIYSILTITSVLTVIQSFGLISLITLGLNIMILLYMISSLLYDTRLWKEFKLNKAPLLNDISNINYFYTITILAAILLTINLVQTSTFDGAILSIIVTSYTALLARYIYLYKEHITKNAQLKKEEK